MKKRISAILSIILLVTCVFSNYQIAFASDLEQQDSVKPRIELRYSVSENQTLEAGETYSAEVWLYNVADIKSGEIALNGQKSTFGGKAGNQAENFAEAISWNKNIDTDASSFKGSIMPIMSTDKIAFSFKAAVNIGSEGMKIATVTVANTEAGAANLSFGGWGMRASNIANCILKNDSGKQIYLTNNEGTFDVIYTWKTNEPAKPRLELRYNVEEDQTLEAGETYSAEVWLYNVADIKSGEIALNGQKSTFGGKAGNQAENFAEAISWNKNIDTDASSFKGSIMPIMSTDKIAFSFKAAVNIGSEGMKIATVTVANTEAGTANLSFGGWGRMASKIVACFLKDTSGNQIYSTNNEATFDVIYTWKAKSEVGGNDDPVPVWESTWPNFRGSNANNAIVNYMTPVSGDNTALKWSSKQGSGYTDNVGQPLLIGDYVYTTSASEVLQINKATGTVEKRCTLRGSTGWNTVSPAYGTIGETGNKKGVVFISLMGGQMQAVEAATMKSLWISDSACSGQNQCPVVYDDQTQLVYTGYWSSESAVSSYVCFDGNTGNIKWKIDHKGGFYWAGGLLYNDYLIVGSDNGDDGSSGNSQNSDYDLSTLYVINKQTGEIIDSQKTLVGDQRGGIVNCNGILYFTTKAGYLYKAEVNQDGKIKKLEGKEYVRGLQSTSTPVVYHDRVYFGLGAGYANTGRQFVLIAKADTLEEIYRAPMKGYPQGSGLLSTAYEGEDGTAYIYFTYNRPPGGVTLLKDKPGQENPVVEELYIPEEEKQQYCLSSIISDTDGTLYYINDSGNLFALEKNEAFLNNITLVDNMQNSVQLRKSKGDASSSGFSGGYLNYYAVTDKSATSVTFTFEKPEGTEISVNEEKISNNTTNINLENEQEEVSIKVTKGTFTRTYKITIKKASIDTSLSILGLAAGSNVRDYSPETVKNASAKDCGLMEPNLSAEVFDYTIGRIYYGNTSSPLRLDVRPNSSGAIFSLKAEDRTQIKYADSVLNEDNIFLKVRREWQDEWTNNYGVKDEVNTATWYYQFSPAENMIEGDIKLILTVTAEDGKTANDYNITVHIDRKAPEVQRAAVNKNSNGSLEFNLNINENGNLYYVLSDISDKTPEKGDILSGAKVAVSEGLNKIALENGSEGKKIYYILEDKTENLSEVNAISIPKNPSESLNDKISVSFRLIGSTHTDAGKEVDLSKGKEGYYGAEYQTWITTKSYTLDKGATVYDLFKKATEESGLQSIGAESGYVRTIYAPKVLGGEALSEFTNGKYSGWMYTVNGNHPNVGLKNYKLQNGESVIWHYVNDYRYEPADWYQLGGTTHPAASDSAFHNEWLKAPDRIGGTGGGSPVAEEVKDVTTDTKAGTTAAPTEVKVSEKTNADGTKTKVADVKVSADNQKEILKQAKASKSKEIILNVSSKSVGDATKADVTLEKSFIDSIVKDTDAKLTIKTPFGDKTYTQDELKGLSAGATGSTITITVEKAEEPIDDNAEKVKKAKSIVKDLKFVARSAKTAKKNIKITVKTNSKTTAAIKELKDLGYTVKYRYYRSTKKASAYKSSVTKSTKTYINTAGKKGRMYYYKAQVRVYDENGKLIAKTALKQCKYANRAWSR